ncbi:hypothetical protein ACLKA6_014675 [Drosophila palustris]
MKLFFCVFGLLTLASANPGNMYVGECISCTDIRTNYSSIPESANSDAGQLARKIADNLARDLNKNFGGQIPGPVIYKPKQTSNGARTQQVGEQGHFVIGKCTDCKDGPIKIMEQEFHKEMSTLETEPVFCEVRRQIL